MKLRGRWGLAKYVTAPVRQLRGAVTVSIGPATTRNVTCPVCHKGVHPQSVNLSRRGPEAIVTLNRTKAHLYFNAQYDREAIAEL